MSDVAKQKAKVNEYRLKRICEHDHCYLDFKHKRAVETTAGVYRSDSPAPYRHIVSATWGREDVTDIA